MKHILVFDTETTTDTTQALNFGCYRIYELTQKGRLLTLIEEGLFYADDLPERYPEGLTQLCEYATGHQAPINHRVTSRSIAVRRIACMPRAEFVEKILWRRAYRYRMGIVGFNLPFDLSRIAVGVGAAKGFYKGGFSFKLWDSEWRPRVLVKHLDSRKSFIGWGTTSEHHWRGIFIDCRTLAFGLSNQAHSLESACNAFGVDGKAPLTEHGRITGQYIDYCRGDVAATARLYDALMREFSEHPIPQEPHRVYSPATLAKGYLSAMGIQPLYGRTSVPTELMGATMSTFYGGRAECRIRRQTMPVSVLDFTSMYPTVAHLMRLWDLITARDIVAEEIALDLSDVDLDYCLNPNHWSEFVGIAQVMPDRDILPVRARYGPGAATIGVNYLSAAEPQWYAIPDVVASRILTGRAPQVLRAVRFRATGRGELVPVELLGRIPVDPARDFFRYAVEERQRVKASDPKLAELLKVLANSGSYGIFAQINRQKLSEPVNATLVYRDGIREVKTDTLESPGQYFYPPLATLPTSGARLMLALLEAMVVNAGGYWVFMDTDSCAVTARGEELDTIAEKIIERFDALNPYDRSLIPHMLKMEFRGSAYAVSAKRYALMGDGGQIVKTSQHGLGYLLSPIPGERTGWISRIWEGIINRDDPPEWIERPALTPHTVSSWTLYDAFRTMNKSKPYADQVKPFNFMLIATVDVQWRGTRDMLLLAPYEPDPTRWDSLTWVDRYNPSRSYVRPPLRTFDDVMGDYAIHPESKFEDLNGKRCGAHTTGFLRRRWIYAPATRVIGKESNSLEGEELFTLDGVASPLLGKTWEQWLPLVEHFLDRCVENGIVSRRQVAQYYKGEKPKRARMKAIVQAATQYALSDLKGHRLSNRDPGHILNTWYQVHHGDPRMPF